jgi:hypothetical protein
MAEKKQQEFTVTDRRLFNSEGELRQDSTEEVVQSAAPEPPGPAPANPPSPSPAAPAADSEMPAPPTAAEQKQQADAYRQSVKDMDTRVELSGHSAHELNMTFERFMASLYMTAMLQLGLMHEEGGQPRIDLIGARQTIDTLGLLQEKTRANLTSGEENFLHNCLYELRMAYVEVTNALARGPQAPAKGSENVTR